jgi:hypothetical protein
VLSDLVTVVGLVERLVELGFPAEQPQRRATRGRFGVRGRSSGSISPGPVIGAIRILARRRARLAHAAGSVGGTV